MAQPHSIPDEYLFRLLDILRPAADAHDMNGPAFAMLAQEIIKLDMDVEDITLGELAACSKRAAERYDVMCKRLDLLGVR